jgi:putative ABC transport system permease protein
VSSIIVLLTKDFALLVVLAVLVASPLAWFGMRYWLQDFAYRTPIHWWIFVVAGLGALLLAVLTVSYQATKVALLNPIKALRTE